MYTVSTLQMAQTLDLRFLLFVPRYFIFIALAVWSLTFAGMAHNLAAWLARLARAAFSRRQVGAPG
jgi:hypothetical protein